MIIFIKISKKMIKTKNLYIQNKIYLLIKKQLKTYSKIKT